VLLSARTSPFTTKSTIAREQANFVAIAASEGLLTTRLDDQRHINAWLVTEDGLAWMREIEDVFGD
jgi:hypothetical protein